MVTIGLVSKNVYAVEDFGITCYLVGIPDQTAEVIWTSPTATGGGHIDTVQEGIFDPGTKSQFSILFISAAKLVELRGYAESHTFTCKIIVGPNNIPVADQQTISIFNPSKNTSVK